MTSNGTPPKYRPTPAEIRAACERIQAEWSEMERMSRYVGDTGLDPDRLMRVCRSEIREPEGE